MLLDCRPPHAPQRTGPPAPARPGSPHGFTLIELLVVITIICLLMVLLLPAIQQCREAARRAWCKQDLRQLTLGLLSYHDQYECLPAGTVETSGPIPNAPRGYHHNWVVALLPHIGYGAIGRQVDPDLGIYDLRHRPLRRSRVPMLLCPSDPARAYASVTGERLEPALTNYAGCHHPVEAPIDVDNLGVLYLNSFLPLVEIRDGTSHTIAIGEILRAMDDLGWASGTRATLRNTGTALGLTPGGNAYFGSDEFRQIAGSDFSWGSREEFEEDMQRAVESPDADLLVGGFGSHHTVGGHLALCDGSVRFVSSSTTATVWEHLGHRADGALPQEW